MNTKALIVIDFQNDFVEGGTLEIKGALSLLPKINDIIEQFDMVIYTKDWHPINHISFNTIEHCIEGTHGAGLVEGLSFSKNTYIFKKGAETEIPSYSAFYDSDGTGTGLTDFLKERGIDTIFILGLNVDNCVFNTIKDAKQIGLDVILIDDATISNDIDLNIEEECIKLDVGIINSEDIKLIL